MIAQKKILVVEDNQINRTMLSGILSPQYQVLEAENGLEALSVLETHKDEISLILLDIVMPVMDGATFLSVIKKDPAYSSIPVIVTTQNDGESDEVAALSHGASDFVAKPYRPQIILHRVASIINLRETAAMINQVQYDRLTGLYSKEFFYQRVRDLIVQHPDQAYDIVCSDIENFKLVNDVFGIPAGDRLLRGIADLYTARVGDRGICGRLNADQFACLLERGQAYTDDLFIQAGAEVNALSAAKNVVMKWGIYSCEHGSVTVEQMCDRAILAARSIKGQYGKYFAFYDDTLRDELLREQAITDGMEDALAQGQFEIYLQPKYRIENNLLAGAEALVRWNHPKWGLQSPAVFIPIFEKNGFITKLDQFVWDRACAVLREWDDKGYPSIPVSVNVSRADIYNANIADILIGAVQKYQLSPSRLHLEITESAYTENPDQIINTVAQLRELGFVIEMDDFGSGYSSLNMLNQMPLDILKLDMKFIQSETAKPASQGILRFIMSLARWMNLSVVAEGVETGEQLTRLQGIGCDYVQGYFFARPMPCSAFEKLLQKLHSGGTREERRPEGAGEATQPQTLLIADEDAQYRKAARKSFGDRYRIVEAGDSESALDCIASCEEKLAAVVLSLTLPDCFSILEALQREKAVWNIPIVATGPSDERLEEKALLSGADDYAGKPHLQTSLRRRVQRAAEGMASRKRECELRDEACRDYLTGLLNRRGFYGAIEALHREEGPFAVYLFDLDDLKKINDTYGHMEGDHLLMQFGALLRSHTRETDIVARFGGDEFVAVVKHMTAEENALKRGTEICRALRKSCLAQKIPAAASAGTAMWDAVDPVASVIGRVDEALYCAKTKCKGECCAWKRRNG